MTQNSIEYTWRKFKIFFLFDIAFTLIFIFANPVSESNQLYLILAIIAFSLFSLGFYGNLAHALSGRQLASLIGFWKSIPIIGYLPLWFHMKKLVKDFSVTNVDSQNMDVCKNQLANLEKKSSWRLLKVIFITLSTIFIIISALNTTFGSFLKFVIYIFVLLSLSVILYFLLKRIAIYVIFGSIKSK